MAFQQYDWKYQQERKRLVADAPAKIAERDEILAFFAKRLQVSA